MITPGMSEKGRIIRVLTYGKEAEAIDQAILDAVAGGHRVLVKVASTSGIPEMHSAADAAVAGWAAALSQTHGLNWERVGSDVLFGPPPSLVASESS